MIGFENYGKGYPLVAGLILLFFLAVCSFLGCLVCIGRYVLNMRSSPTPPPAVPPPAEFLYRRPPDDNEASMRNPLLADPRTDSASEAASAVQDPELGGTTTGARGAASAQQDSRADGANDSQAASESAAE